MKINNIDGEIVKDKTYLFEKARDNNIFSWKI